MELMITIAVFAILAAIATPAAFSWMTNIRFNNAVREVKGVIEDARLQAVKENADTRIQFNSDNATYRVGYFDRSSGAFVDGPSRKLPSQVQLSAAFGGNSTLRFNGRGMAIDAGEVQLVKKSDGTRLWVEVTLTGNARITDEDPTAGS